MKKKVFILTLTILGYAGFVNAGEIFPLTARTIVYEQSGATTGALLLTVTTPIVILSVNMRQSGVASDTSIKCAGVTIAKNFAKDVIDVPMNYYCTGNLTLDKTGTDTSFMQITYRNFYELPPAQDYTYIKGEIEYPVLSLWLGLASFFTIFFATIFYFRRNRSVLVNRK